LKRLAPYHRELVWALLLLSVVVVAPFFPAPVADPGSDTWSVRPGGKKVLWALARRIFGDVRRQTGGLPPTETAATLCILGPARHPDAAEWQKLYTWVAAGNTLVFAARRDDPAVSLGPFGLRIRPGEDTGASLVLDEALMPAPGAPIEWESGAWIDGGQPGAWVPIRSGSRPVAVFQKVGQGLLVAVASDELFENAWIVNRERGLVAIRLLEKARRSAGAVFMDESLTASGPPRVFGLLLSPFVRPVTLQVLAVFLLFGWSGSRGFGALVGAERPPRRQITEHARALGRLHQLTATGGTLVAAYLEYVRHEVKMGRRAAGNVDPAELLSRRARVEIQGVRALLGRASRAARESSLRGDEAAAAIRSLAEIRTRAMHSGGRPSAAAGAQERR
jgi:uncharacterized protein DUF4350